MEEGTGLIVPAVVAGLLLACLGFEIERKRSHLRRVFGLLDRDELKLVGLLDTMVAKGEIRALSPQG